MLYDWCWGIRSSDVTRSIFIFLDFRILDLKQICILPLIKKPDFIKAK